MTKKEMQGIRVFKDTYIRILNAIDDRNNPYSTIQGFVDQACRNLLKKLEDEETD